MRLVSVAVPVPFLPPLTYRVPDTMDVPRPGTRVVVPLGGRTVTGCVIPSADAGDERDPTMLKELRECLDQEPLLPPDVLDLALWVAEYYASGPGEAVATAMPPFVARASAFKTLKSAHLTEHGRAAMEAAATGTGPRFGTRQREGLALLAASPEGMTLSALDERGVAPDTVHRLVKRGLVALARTTIERDPFATATTMDGIGSIGEGELTLTDEQRVACETLSALGRTDEFRVALLHGVTGSGKTEVYLRLARETCARGRRALVLVPEIALTPAVAWRFHQAFPNRVAIQHSGLSDGERHDQWHRIRRGEVDVVVGTRSAVFAPLDRIGLIVVDEEHDASYKQEEAPRYHGRDVAVVRGQRAGALVVLGSATPSMESYRNATTGRYTRVVLSRRILERPLADVQLIDMRDEMTRVGPDVVISDALGDALTIRLERGEQALVLLNRRGFASAVFCRQCGHTLECPNCSVSLTLHQAAGRARCHYCNYSVRRPATCPQCAGPYLEQAGFGTERIEAEICTLLPEARVARLDRDTVRRRGALQTLLSRFARGEIDILVGTQMIAKGHDFPNVTLVGVVSADVGLGLADFRAAERTFQLLTQVAGRAGRGERRGVAIIQTLHAGHYSIELACRQAYVPFYEAEIAYRHALRYPPEVSMINTVVRARSLGAAMADAGDLADRLRGREAPYVVLGPAPAPLTRLRGEHRAQFFLKGQHRPTMREALLAALETRPELRRRVTIDVDPLTVL